MEYVRSDISVTKTSEATAERSKLIGKKHIIIEAHQTNTKKVYIGLSYEYTGAGRLSTEYDTLEPMDVKFYSAPKGKQIHYVWYWCESGTQYINIIASDGSMQRMKDLAIEKKFPWDYISSLLIEPGDAETAKSANVQLHATEEVLLLGFIVHCSNWTKLDRIQISQTTSADVVKNIPVKDYYLCSKEKEHRIMLQKPLVLAIGDKIIGLWQGTASVGNKIAINIIQKRITAITA